MKPKKTSNRNGPKSAQIKSPTSNENYTVIGCIGSGTFGNTYEILLPDGRRLALKKVLQDPHYKNRELDIIKQIKHPNCLHLYDSQLVREGNETYLLLFTDIFPIDLHQYLLKITEPMPINLIKVFGYQLFNGLDYVHQLGITHRDIKTSNVLVNPENGYLEICDFGSAKRLYPDEPSLSYISTRMYRAPELLYCSQYYNSQVDVWAAGCVIAEMINKGQEIFRSASNDELIVKIAKSIGMPSDSDYVDMKATVKKSSKIKGKGIRTLFNDGVDSLLIDLLEKIFVYSPCKRLTAAQAKAHPFFKGVTTGEIVLPNGNTFNLPTK